jgi:hypothetical protein
MKEGLKIDYANEPMLSECLEQAKSNLFENYTQLHGHYRDGYP